MLAGPVGNVDATVICEAPQLGAAPRRDGAQPHRRRSARRSASRRRPTRAWVSSAAARESPALRWRSSSARRGNRVRRMDLRSTRSSLARKVKLGSLGLAARRAVQPQDARRGRRDPADAARTSSPASPASSPAGAPRRPPGSPARRSPTPTTSMLDRRGGRAHLRRAAPALERARPRACASEGVGRATGSRSWPATTAASSTRPSPSRSSAPTAST